MTPPFWSWQASVSAPYRPGLIAGVGAAAARTSAGAGRDLPSSVRPVTLLWLKRIFTVEGVEVVGASRAG